MDLNIDQLDSEERKKINALLRERNDVNKDKGVEYIFRQPDEREEFLLGKKIDLNKMVKDEKAMMGESESEFQERMEKRKLMQKMREDPMAIIQLNEQQAHKVALEKQKVHQKLSKAHNSKFRRKTSASSSDSDSSGCMDKLRELLEKQIDNDDDNPILNILNKINPKITNRNQNTKQLSTSPKIYKKKGVSDYYKQTRERNKSRSYSSNYSKVQAPERSQQKLSKHEKVFKKSNFQENEKSKVGISSERSSKHKRHRHSRSRSPYIKYKSGNVNHRTDSKRKLSKEEREKRLQEMKDNAQELDLTIQDLDRKFQKQDKKETEDLKKNLKNSEEYMFKEIVKINSSISSLQSNLKERRKLSNVDKYFKC